MGTTKRNLGLKDIYVAKVLVNNSTTYTCATPEELCRAIKAKITVKKNSEKLYSGSEIEDTLTQFESVEVELEGDHISAEMVALLNGASYVNGVLTEKTTDVSAEVALMFRDKRANGKYEFTTLYCGKFGEEDSDEHETSEDKIKTQTKTIKGTFYGRSVDSAYRNRIYEDELIETDTDATTIIASFYSAVPKQVPAI
jgi:phi13 family phage major tail protein